MKPLNRKSLWLALALLAYSVQSICTGVALVHNVAQLRAWQIDLEDLREQVGALQRNLRLCDAQRTSGCP